MRTAQAGGWRAVEAVRVIGCKMRRRAREKVMRAAAGVVGVRV